MFMNSNVMSRFGVFFLMGIVLATAGCSSYNLRKNGPGVNSSSSRSLGKAPLEIKSEEVLPYTAKLTYGEICFNSKRYGRPFCFPCYNVDQGGCDAAVEDLVDKAIACSSPIGPSSNQLNAPQRNNFPTAPLAQPQFPLNQFQQPLAVPNVYPNFTR